MENYSGGKEEGSKFFLIIIACQDGHSPSPLASFLFPSHIHSFYSAIRLCLAKKIADTASSKLWIGSPGQVGLLTSEGSESRGGEERARQKERQQKSLL